MSDILTIESFLECHKIATSLNVTIDIDAGAFRVKDENGKFLTKKTSIGSMRAYLEGYRDRG